MQISSGASSVWPETIGPGRIRTGPGRSGVDRHVIIIREILERYAAKPLQEAGIDSSDTRGKRPSIQTKELQQVSKRIGRLAVARYGQTGEFRIRQREKLRRALQDAAEALDWNVIASVGAEPVKEVSLDVQRLTRAGMRAIEKDLESELLEKRREIRQLEGAIKTLSELAAEDPSTFPQEVAYTYTATRGKGEYVTKEEELVLEDPGSAEAAARKLEKRLARFGRLRDQMVEHLKQKRKTVKEAKAELKDFVQGTRRLVSEVLLTLH